MHVYIYTHTYTYNYIYVFINPYTPIYTYIYTHIIYIYIQTYTHLNVHSYLNIPVLTKRIRYNIWTEKYVDLYLYDKLQFALLEKYFVSSSDSSSLFFNLLRNRGENKIVFSNSCR